MPLLVVVAKDLAADGDAAFPADVKVTGADTLCIPYSSGTSGMPKGVSVASRQPFATTTNTNNSKNKITKLTDTNSLLLPAPVSTR